MDGCPHYHLVPKPIPENLAFRQKILTLGQESSAYISQFKQMCAEDILFWLNTVGWTYDPRKPDPALPFITWPFQDDGLLAINDAIEKGHDLLIEKSRDMGASWMFIAVYLWRWQFKPLQSFLMGSRKEEFVDKTGDPKSLFWKADFLLKYQPKWLVPPYSRQKLHLHNEQNDSTLDGESTNADFARGDRRTSIGLDEFPAVENGYEILSATADATPCRLFMGTPKGTANAHYEIRQKGDVKILRFHWSQHPEKGKDLYKDEHGRLRSPWYDSECKRRTHPAEIAQELDIDYQGSDYQFFDVVILNRLQRETVQLPMFTGRLIYDPDFYPVEFMPGKGKDGYWTFWCDPNIRNDKDQFIIGVDPAPGTGAANSSICVLNRVTGEQVAEYASPLISPPDLAKQAVAASRWFRGNDPMGGLLIWEANGPGRIFGDRVLDIGYRNIYYRENERSIGRKQSDFPGWWATKETKTALLGEFRRAMASGEFIIRSRSLLDECRHYVFLLNQTIAHSQSQRTIDPSGARENHGDRVVAAALCWRGRGPARHVIQRIRPFGPPMGSFAWRRDQVEKRKAVSSWV